MVKNFTRLTLFSVLLTACGTPSTSSSNTPKNTRLTESHFLGKWLITEGSTPACQEITTFLPNRTWIISSNKSRTAGIWSFNDKTQKLTMQFTSSNLQANCEGDKLDANDFNQIKGIDAVHAVRVAPQGLFVETLDANGKPNNDSYHLQKLP